MYKSDWLRKGAVLTICAVINHASAESYQECNKYPSDNLRFGRPYVTPLGTLELYRCESKSNDNSLERVVLGGKELFSEYSLWLTENNKEGTVFIYGGGVGRESMLGGCTGVQYLLDLTGNKPRLIKFGINNACNQVNQVQWKKDRVTINFNRDAKFSYVYGTGKMKLPEDNQNFYDPIIDENSPVINEYMKSTDPHQKYRLAPPYAKEIELMW